MVGMKLLQLVRMAGPLQILALSLTIFLGGCRAADPTPRGSLLPPLRLQQLPLPPMTQLRLPVGTTQAAPILVALVDDKGDCAKVFEAIRGSFVICHADGEPASTGSAALREALKTLQGALASYLAGPPVAVFAAAGRTEGAMRLVSEEPSFFASLAIQSGDVVSVSNTRVHAYGLGGGVRLALAGADSALAQRLSSASRASNLEFRAFDSSPSGLSEALSYVTPSPLHPPGAATPHLVNSR